jgi:hypothetical protein
MAKSSVPGLDRIRDLFTAAERAVLEATAGSTLLSASRKQLDQTLARVREFRDKWRGLHAGQARKSKRAAAGTAANLRSREKADVFTAAIDRLQARLAEIGLAAAPAKPKAVTKVARQAGHRTARSGVKSRLAAAAADLNRGRASRPAAKAVAVPAAAGAAAKTAAPAAAGKPKPGKKRRPAALAAATLAKGGGQPLRFDVTQQRSAKASATAARLKFDGQITRRGGHTLAAGKRRQAARDRRSR